MSKTVIASNGNDSATFEIGGSMAVGRTNQGVEIRAVLLRLTRHAAVFEMYEPSLALRFSEVFEEFTISFHERTVYSGRAVVRSLVDAGVKTICEVVLEEGAWVDLEFNPVAGERRKLRNEFDGFFREWGKLYRVSPEYKVVVADLHTFLTGLNSWLEQVQLRTFSSPASTRAGLEDEIAMELRDSVVSPLTHLFARFEDISEKLDESLLLTHREFIKRQLHPLMLCSPFMHRTYSKPLGYAGDYEMMSMVVRNGFEGKSLYAKLVNSYLLAQPPCEAVRNRVDYLEERIVRETSRMARGGKVANIFCVACGPAWEAVNFISKHSLADMSKFHLLDFNAETLDYTTKKMNEIKRLHNRTTDVELVKNSVHNLLRANSKATPPEPKYDLIYCSGLYDYLNDRVCQSLNDHLYNLLKPGGLMVVGNFAPFTPGQNLMEHLMDWFLIYRDSRQLSALVPERAVADNSAVFAEISGSNIFLEVRKPK